MRHVIFILFSPINNEQRGGGMLPYFLFCSLFPVQQTTSGIGHRVKYFFRVGNQCAECEKLQQTTKYLKARQVKNAFHDLMVVS